MPQLYNTFDLPKMMVSSISYFPNSQESGALQVYDSSLICGIACILEDCLHLRFGSLALLGAAFLGLGGALLCWLCRGQILSMALDRELADLHILHNQFKQAALES